MAPSARVPLVLLLVGLLAGALVLRGPIARRFGGATQAERLVTDIGRRGGATLDDGTQVELSVATTLVHPPRFPASDRTVVLSGEAYFAVVPDSLRPFIVTAAPAAVETRGASFGIRANPEQGTAQVVVTEGTVTVRRASRLLGGGTVLRAGQVARMTRDGAITRRAEPNIDRLTAWRRGRIVFSSVPLRNAIVELRRWHAVDLRIGDSVVANRRVTAEFAATQTLTEVLDEIALGIGAVYRSQGGVVTFRRER